MNDKLNNLITEICSMIETGSITVGALGLSQDSADYAMELYRKKDYIKIDPQDIKTLLNMLQDNPTVCNYIREYIYYNYN